MHNLNERPSRRPKLFLPLFLAAQGAGAGSAKAASFPLSPEQLRRTVAEMIG